jgi:hypothetical protein
LLNQKSVQLLWFWIRGQALQHRRKHLPRRDLGREQLIIKITIIIKYLPPVCLALIICVRII